jgi:PAS domain S-box-containing protein
LDPTTVLFQLAFVALFAVSVWRYLRHRDPLQLSVVAVFGSFVALFLLSFVNALAPALAPFARPALITVLFAQPYLILRLIDQIQPVSLVASRIVLLGAVVSIAAVLIAPGQPISQIPAVGYFFVAEVASAALFAIDSRRRFGLARVRLALAAVATGLSGGTILIAGIASAMASGGPSAPSAQVASRLLAVLAGAGYLAAFAPPAGLRGFMYRALAFDLVRNLVAPPAGTDEGRLWQQLASTAREILGARTVSILTEPGGVALATVGEPAGAAGGGTPRPSSAMRRSESTLSTVEVSVRGDGAVSEQLLAQVEGRPLFVEDDVALLQMLGSLTARAVDREHVLIGLGETKRALEESATIKASEARFRALLEAEPNAILALDENGRVTWATRQAGELFGAPTAKLVGIPLSELVVLHHEAVVASPSTDRPVVRAETTGRRSDGTRFPAEIARTEFQLDGRPFQLAVISDVSWRHEADQIRERFLGVLSHELRTPVTSIYGGTQLLLGRGSRLGEETRTELLMNVAAESERLQRMIENLVAMARVEQGADFAGPRPVLIERLLKQLVDRERGLWPEVTIKLTVHGPVQMVAADEEYLAQIMRNLLSNAAKYGGAGATVEVVVMDGPEEVLVLVRDDGPGIEIEDADKLFNLYYRAAQQASTATGAGIGLFVCRELVSTMGGRIWARPLEEGGAEFGFSLPAYPDELEPVLVEDRRPALAEPTTQQSSQAAATA